MSKFTYFCFILFGAFSISCQSQSKNILGTEASQQLVRGADRQEEYLPLLEGKRVGVITNASGVLQDGRHLVDELLSKNINIKKIFSPEHGFRADADAGAVIKNEIDPKTGLLILSLYGKNKKPSAESLQDIDVLLFDIQDVGVRFYTYISTLTLCMEAAAENNIPLIVLDRPNPHDGYIDGPVLEKEFTSFIGMHPVPVIYGLTIGEYGALVNGEAWLHNGVKCDYHMIPMKNYHKKNKYPLQVAPSPNLKTAHAIAWYPSLCFFEGTEVSVGRGTDAPFEQFGSPWITHTEFSFIPKPNRGASVPLFKNQVCYGRDVRKINAPEFKLDIHPILWAYRNFQKNKKDFFLENGFFDKLAGTALLRKQIISGESEKSIRQSWQKDLQSFESIRKKYRIYPD